MSKDDEGPRKRAGEAAEAYMALGWYPLPLRPGSKACRDEDWRTRVYRASDFADGDNVGLWLSPASDKKRQVKLCAVDLDSPEAVALAARFLPPGAPAWGRASKPISQALYDSPLDRAIAIKDGDATVVELRTNHQSMAPPSVHPDGERLFWVGSNGPRPAPKVDPPDLVKAVRSLATAAILARHWPGRGGRHAWTLAVSGGLRKMGLAEDDAASIIAAAAELAGDDEAKDRVAALKGTYAKSEEEAVAAFGRLAETAGEALGTALKAAWGWREGGRGPGRPSGNDTGKIREAVAALGYRLKKDLFSGKALVWNGDSRPETLSDSLERELWFKVEEQHGFRPSREFFTEVILNEAERNPTHPVREWLAGLTWDGEPRVGGWLVRYGGAKDTPFARAVGRLVLVAAVRRVRKPGCKFDELLVLEGRQGRNKSTAIRALCPVEDWFSDDLPMGVDAKQVIERTSGKWLIEAAELTHMRKAQIEQLKAMLSRQTDGPVRLAYGHISTEVPRQFMAIGTTNSYSYLKDPTGNRRFWPVTVDRFDAAAIARDRDQIWAEAAKLEADGEGIRLDPALWGAAAEEQEDRVVEDPWEDMLRRFVGGGAPDKVATRELYAELGIDAQKMDMGSQERLAAIMQKCGYVKARTLKMGGRAVNGWRREGASRQLGIDNPGNGNHDPGDVE